MISDWFSAPSVGSASLAALLVIIVLLGSIMVALLIPPIIWPTVIAYPWKVPTRSSKRDRDRKRTVILAGSYNPPHKGHLAMLEYLASRYGHVVAVVGWNSNKKYLVMPEERATLLRKMLEGSTEDVSNVRVEVVSGYIWRYAKRIGATVFFRGIRSWEKDGSDERSLQILNTWGPLLLGPTWPVPTVYLEGKPEYNGISSTLIRDLCRGGDQSPTDALSKLVPACVAKEVSSLYCRKES